MDLSAASVAALVTQPPSVARAARTLECDVLRLACSLERSVSSGDLAILCKSLSKSIDVALSFNDVPVIARGLPSLLKQVYHRRNDASFQLQSAMTILMLSVKKACKNGWFHSAESDGLLSMSNELCSSFCTRANSIADVSGVLSIILNIIIPRFYPQLKLCSLIASFEAKPGYDCWMTDFDLKRNLPPEEKIMLLVVERDKLETSSCLVTPGEVSFLINGRGVERRTNVSLDNGPQLPTDITSMVNNEVNIVQAIGCFRGNYIIAIASMSKVAPTVPILNEYVQPIVAIPASDSDIIVGALRVSLICPFSFKRINTPVKGQLCKHLQCFDYENFMEMNSRKPSWRCPFCNQSASAVDLHIDKKMVQILREVGENINEVLISTDGSWNVVEHNNSTYQENFGNMECRSNRCLNSLQNVVEHNNSTYQENFGNMECRPNRCLNSLQNCIDLSMEGDAGVDAAASFREVDVLDCASNRQNNDTWGDEDRQPLRNDEVCSVSEISCQPILANSVLMTTQGSSDQMIAGTCSMTCSSTSSNRSLIPTVPPDAHRAGTLASLVPMSVLNPVVRDAPFPTLSLETTAFEVSRVNFSTQISQQAGQIPVQFQQPSTRSLIISNGIVRQPIARNVNQSPIALQPLAAQSQETNATQWTNLDMLVSSSDISCGSLSLPYQTIPSMTTIQDGYSTGGGNIGIRQSSETSGAIAPPHQLHAINQNQYLQGTWRILNPVLRGVGLGSSSSSYQWRGTGAYRASLQHPADLMTGVSLTQFQQESQYAGSSAVESLVNQHNQNSIAQHASQLGTEQPVVQSRTAFRIGPSVPIVGGFSQRGEQVNMVGGAPIPDGNIQLSSEEQWQPTGRMRGSITGNAYSAALSRYLGQSSQ